MKAIIPALLMPAICLSLAADTTGRIAGKVTNKAGQPIAGATVTLKRIDINWSKQLTTAANGTYIQAGLEPKDFDIIVEAAGYQSQTMRRKIDFKEVNKLDFVLFTEKEAQAEALKAAIADNPGLALDAAGSDAFNQAVAFYNTQMYPEALPLVDKAHKNLSEAIEKAKDEESKAETRGKLVTVERVHGLVLYEVGKTNTDEAQKKAQWLQAEPMLAASLERAPKDQRLLTALHDVAKLKGDAAAAKQYQARIDEIVGPRPELAYNQGVEAFNASKYSDAKVFFEKAIQTDPKFADSYYMLGLVETNQNHLKAAKAAFDKYLEIAPSGKKAGEVKELLAGLRQMGVK